MRTARAAILERLGCPLVVRDIELPALLPGQVLVKVLFSGVCRSQLMEVRGARGHDPWLPHLLGHEGSGEVLEIGAGVTKIQPGDEVIMGWIKGQGVDAPGAKYLYGNQIVNSGRVTTFSNYSIVSETRIVKKPQGLSNDVATLFGCALLTGAGMVLNELHSVADCSVAVIGLGGIGLSALMALNSVNCKQIIAIDLSDEKLILAKDCGATHLFNPSRDNVAEKISALTQGGVDICIESAGATSTIELGFSLVRKGGGKLLFASHPPEGAMIRLAPHDLISGKQIAGSWGGCSAPDRDIPRMFHLFKQSNAPLERLITKRYRLEQINDALSDLDAGMAFRPLIVMDHS